MLWSVGGTGKAKDVAAYIADQIGKIKLFDPGEMETVRKVGDLISQTLSTFEPEKPVMVAASGHMGFADGGAKTMPYQRVTLSIEPIHFDA